MAPDPNRSKPGRFDPHSDDPLTKGIDLMLMKKKQLESLICCRGCGIPLQTHDPTNVGFVRFAKYLDKWSQKQHRRILCNRCLELERGELRPVVKETLGSIWPMAGSAGSGAKFSTGFGGHVVPADVLYRQLRMIRERRCLVLYVLDLLDFNGSFVRNLRECIGRNPTLVIGTKLDLLPGRTDPEQVRAWLKYALKKKRLRVMDVKLISSVTGRGVNQATNAVLEFRRGLDVFVVGAANAGKSMFIRQLLDQLEQRYPEGKVEDCERPVVSRTPGTTLGTMPLRAFRRSGTSPVFACLYDTPGVHQPNSMQNLLPVEIYDTVQPTKAFGVQVKVPARDALAALREAGEALTAEAAKEWLKRPVRYLWGPLGAPPVAGIEVTPPIPPALELAFVGVEGLAVECVAGLVPQKAEDGATAVLEPPEGLALAQVCYVKPPERLSLDGEVLTDIALAGFGWVAVSVKAVSAAAADRPVEMRTISVRVFGPARLKVKVGACPMPVAGLPGIVTPPPAEQEEEEEEEEPEFAPVITPPATPLGRRLEGASDESFRADGEHPLARSVREELPRSDEDEDWRASFGDGTSNRGPPRGRFDADDDDRDYEGGGGDDGLHVDPTLRRPLGARASSTEWSPPDSLLDDDGLPDDDLDFDPMDTDLPSGGDQAWVGNDGYEVHQGSGRVLDGPSDRSFAPRRGQASSVSSASTLRDRGGDAAMGDVDFARRARQTRTRSRGGQRPDEERGSLPPWPEESRSGGSQRDNGQGPDEERGSHPPWPEDGEESDTRGGEAMRFRQTRAPSSQPPRRGQSNPRGPETPAESTRRVPPAEAPVGRSSGANGMLTRRIRR